MAQKAVGLTVTSTTIGAEGFVGGDRVADPINAAGAATDVTDIATSSAAITATAALIATDNTDLTTATTDIGTSSTAITATAALLATDATDIGTTSDAAVEASIAVLEADGAVPTQAHVNDLRALWNTMRTRVATFVTNSGTATTDASTLATQSTSLTADVAPTPAATDVVLSYDTTAVGNRSVLRRAVNRLLDGVAATNDFAS